jgi:hypothetical protein
MPYKQFQQTIQFSLIVFCCLFVAVTRTEVSVNSQSCVVPHWETPPKDSWHQNEQVAVRIDDAWDPTERGYFQQGIEEWNQALNCSGVNLHDFRSIHFTDYGQAPPDYTLWWQRRSPVGVLYFFTFPQNLQRLRAAIVPIPPSFQNSISNSYFVYLGTHETGHTFDLGDCLASNNCQTTAGTCSIMGGHSQSSVFNTGGPLPADNAAVDVVYCPLPCEQYCDLESCGLNCVAKDTCSYPNNEGCPDGYQGGLGRGCCTPQSPIVVDVSGNGVNLSDAELGVVFDLSGNGASRHLAWTTLGSDDAWLVLDRNNNGTIENGTELFGNFTPQPVPPAGSERNGFLALAEYDKTVNGGNADGVISSLDSIFTSLRLWQDINHNGISESPELNPLSALGLMAIELDYKASPKVDQYGNSFRYRAKVTNTQGVRVGRWAWDVFLVSTP